MIFIRELSTQQESFPEFLLGKLLVAGYVFDHVKKKKKRNPSASTSEGEAQRGDRERGAKGKKQKC